MTEKEIKKFFRFLKEIGVYTSYIKNTNESKREKKTGPKTIKEFMNYVDLGSAVCGAFTWSKTREGHIFWAYISDQWMFHNSHLSEELFKIIKEKMPLKE